MKKKHKKKRWSIQDKMALLIFVLMTGTVVFCGALAVQQMVIRATNTGPLDITFEEYERSEMALDNSTENVIYDGEDPEAEDTKGGRVSTTEVDHSKSSAGKSGYKEGDNPYDRTDEVEIPDTRYPYYIKVNRLKNCVTVYTMNKKGKYKIPVKAMVCSVGLHNNTPLGIFRTSTKYKWRELYGKVYGQYAYRIHNSIMFHSVPYFSPSKDDLETEEYNKLGEAASLGCVRLAVEDAKWLVENCPEGTTVEIYEDKEAGPLGKPKAIRIDTTNEAAGWDPTDPDKKNPWRDKK